MIKSIEHNLSNIDDKLKGNKTVREWLKHMPSINKVLNIKEYQENYNTNDPDSHTLKLDSDFQGIVSTIPPGQVLFHRGSWFTHGDKLIFNRYTSATLDPSFCSGNIKHDDIFIVIKIISPNIKFYLFDQNICSGHAEAEVLLEKEIQLVKKCSFKVKKYYNDEYDNIFYTYAYK